MGLSSLFAALSGHRDLDVAGMARAGLAGDHETVGPLFDRLEEMGENAMGMMNLDEGRTYLVLTPTFFWLFRCAKDTPTHVLAREIAWVPETAQFSLTMLRGDLHECEPCPPELEGWVPKEGALFLSWNHAIPKRPIEPGSAGAAGEAEAAGPDGPGEGPAAEAEEGGA